MLVDVLVSPLFSQAPPHVREGIEDAVSIMVGVLRAIEVWTGSEVECQLSSKRVESFSVSSENIRRSHGKSAKVGWLGDRDKVGCG